MSGRAGSGGYDPGPDRYWGLTKITAHDELTLLEVLTSRNKILDLPSRRYELSLMARVVPAECWGVGAEAPAFVTAHVKNGWLPLAELGWRSSAGGSTASAASPGTAATT